MLPLTDAENLTFVICLFQMPSQDSSYKISDYLHVKGVKQAEPGMPQWKLKPLQEKNIQLIKEHMVSIL